MCVCVCARLTPPLIVCFVSLTVMTPVLFSYCFALYCIVLLRLLLLNQLPLGNIKDSRASLSLEDNRTVGL